MFSGFEPGTQSVKSVVTIETVNSLPEQSSHWGENRLADVVKGTVKPKFNNSKDTTTSTTTTTITSSIEVDSPRVQSPAHIQTSQQSSQLSSSMAEEKEVSVNSELPSIASSTVTLTPPSSPEK